MEWRLQFLRVPLFCLLAGGMLVYISCHGSNNGLVDFLSGDVNLRVLNNSDYDFEELKINGLEFGDLPRYSYSRYHQFDQAYHYGAVYFKIDGKEFHLIPIDYVGETPLKSGLYTYMLSVDFENGFVYLTFFEGEKAPGEAQPRNRDRIIHVAESNLATAASEAGNGSIWIAGFAITLTRLNPTISNVPNSKVRYLPELITHVEKRHPLVVQTEANGSEVSRFQPEIDFDHYDEIQLAPADGGVVLAGNGRTDEIDDFDGVLLTKVNDAGHVVWQQQLATAPSVVVHGLLALDNGDFILCGIEEQRTWLARTEVAGDLLWSRRLSGQFVGEDVHQTVSGDFVVAGGRFGDIQTTPTSGLIKTDANGTELLATPVLPGSYQATLETADGHFLLAGSLSYHNLLIVHLDEVGQPIWQRQRDDGRAFDAQTTPDGDFILSGFVHGQNALLRMDSQGTVVWQQTYAAISDDYVKTNMVLATRDGNYLLVGNGRSDILLVKVDGQGQTIFQKSIL